MLFLLISLIAQAQTSDSLIVGQMRDVGIHFYKNNDVRLIMSGKEKFDLMFEDIRNAKSSVHLEYFNFRNDSIASLLFDILRDPPGAYSTASLARGATINYSYMMNLSLASGPVLSMTIGQKQETFLGTVQGAVTGAPGSVTATTTGWNSIADNGAATVQDFVFTMQGTKAYSYSMVLSNAVSTSGDPSMVGADADLYIGKTGDIKFRKL